MSLNAPSWRDPTQVNVRRSMMMMASGAICGLGLAGYALFTARGTSTLHVPAEDVALVNQQPISRIDYLVQLQTLFSVDLQHATAEQRKKVLDDMIREELFVQRGKELDVASTDPEVRASMVNAVELEIAADAITSQPTEARLRAYYESHREKYASEGVMTVHDYLFPSAASQAASDAVQVLKSASASESISRLKDRESGKVGDEQFYFAAKIHLGDQLFEAARALSDGQAAGPLAMPDGLHVLYMMSNKRPRPRDFTAVREQVLSDYRGEAIASLRIGDEQFLRKRANILLADDMRE
jgi:PPIC-type PPIASE domain/SurA N-terminal domain